MVAAADYPITKSEGGIIESIQRVPAFFLKDLLLRLPRWLAVEEECRGEPGSMTLSPASMPYGRCRICVSLQLLRILQHLLLLSPDAAEADPGRCEASAPWAWSGMASASRSDR